MSAVEDGGPAFPHDKYQKNSEGQWGTYAAGGMSLRDWFAGGVLQGTYASREMYLAIMSDRGTLDPDEYVAQQAYQAADAMIAARSRDAS